MTSPSAGPFPKLTKLTANRLETNLQPRRKVPLMETMRASFNTIHDQHADRNGETFEVVEKITEPNAEFDFEVLPMYRIKFADGEVIDAFADEIVAN